MNILSILSMIVIGLGSAAAMSAQMVEFSLRVKNITPQGSREFPFTIAAHPNATSGLDTALGEREIPTLPLPSDVFYVWTVAPTAEPLWLSPKDVRQLKPLERFQETYDVRVNWTGGSLEFSWSMPIPAAIDSAYLIDGYTDFPDNIIKARLNSTQPVIVNNPSINRYKVLVWYNTTTVGVDEERMNAGDDRLRAWPMPCGDQLDVSTRLTGDIHASIHDQQGRILLETDMSDGHGTIDTRYLAPGAYVLHVADRTGNVQRTVFIRQ